MKVLRLGAKLLHLYIWHQLSLFCTEPALIHVRLEVSHCGETGKHWLVIQESQLNGPTDKLKT